MSKQGITQETPLEELDEDAYIKAKVKLQLENNPLTAYTICGLMIQLFGSREININQPFKDWNEHDLLLYKKIKESVEKLVADGFVNVKIEGKGNRGNYWWIV